VAFRTSSGVPLYAKPPREVNRRSERKEKRGRNWGRPSKGLRGAVREEA